MSKPLSQQMTTCRDNNDAHSSVSGVKNGSQGTHLLLINKANCKKIELVSSITIAQVSSFFLPVLST